jgi:hypothetical protein
LSGLVCKHFHIGAAIGMLVVLLMLLFSSAMEDGDFNNGGGGGGGGGGSGGGGGGKKGWLSMVAVVGVFDGSSSIGGNVQWWRHRTTARHWGVADATIK